MNSDLVKYTHRHTKDGNVGIGKLSSQYSNVLNNIAKEYLSIVPDITATTHHKYYTDLKGLLKTEFEKIQFAEFWQGLRIGAFEKEESFASVLENVIEMNEVYYSNPKPNFANGPLYGAAANLIPHKDCILFNFPGIRVYRVIISATEGNCDTVTEFITHNVERHMNRGDYMVFDFDRTLHQVKKTGQLPTPRILLKLHFLTLDMKYARPHYVTYIYLRFAYSCYVLYYRVARYTEQLGTDPTTFIGFFFGILWEYPFYPVYRNSAIAVYFGQILNRIRLQIWIETFARSHQVLNTANTKLMMCHAEIMKNIYKSIVYSTFDMIIIYLCIVIWHYLSMNVTSKTIYSIKQDK